MTPVIVDEWVLYWHVAVYTQSARDQVAAQFLPLVGDRNLTPADADAALGWLGPWVRSSEWEPGSSAGLVAWVQTKGDLA